MIDDEIVAQLVELPGGNLRLHVRGDEVQAFRGQPPGPAHAFEGFGPVDLDVATVGSHEIGGHIVHDGNYVIYF